MISVDFRLGLRLCCAALVQSCALFQLLGFFQDSMGDDDADDVKADKAEAHRLIRKKVLPLFQKLLRSFDPATVDAATGNNALHELCRLFRLSDVDHWPFKMTELIIGRGMMSDGTLDSARCLS